ncbi:hypothetical protein A2Z67_04995 [Candidatus Woesebacteria bacterium RBG_13_36_22]|uniref:Uncharacterized protein n=1 Tax=Candidatus Woesebacteria bacterium RBG_13_36_22 TaxID=1802478 RepID=A0A1F7X4H7_9BACT|nr:MAG: hypothetical protein A2Z67_04995 [Candidatus Woesebacteria bacterium RBG_13_36_22]
MKLPQKINRFLFPPGVYEVKIHSGKSAWIKFGTFYHISYVNINYLPISSRKEVFSGDRFEVRNFIPCPGFYECEGMNSCPGRVVLNSNDSTCFVFYDRNEKQSYFGLLLVKEHMRWKDGRFLRRMELSSI